MLRSLFLALALGTFALEARAGVIFFDNFDAGASPLWGNEVGSWTAAGGVYNAQFPSTSPNASSSLPFNLTDFSIDFDINGVRDGGVSLRTTPAPGSAVGFTGVLLVTGGLGGTGTGLYWHVITNPNSYGGILNPVSGLFINGVSNPHIRVEVTGNTYSAFVNGSAIAATSITTASFPSGRVALYDFSTQTFDNVQVGTADANAAPAPPTMIVFALGLVGLVRRGLTR